MTTPTQTTAVQSNPNPFPGLRPFDANEDHLFFGRDGQSDEILTSLRRNRFVAVVGTSGSGKSSLIRAGLMPLLHGGFMAQTSSNWRIALFRPGSDPIGNMAQALNRPDVLRIDGWDVETNMVITETTLRRGGLGLIEAVRQARMPARTNLLIVVDQFEELFRFKGSGTSESAEDDAAFVKLLIEATAQTELPIYVVITMRSDFIGDCARFRELPETINRGLYLIPLMTRDQRREAITGPAAVAGTEIAPRLINRVLNDAGESPEQLPLLQHALMRTWEHWKSSHKGAGPIDLESYESVGGMEDALSRHADEAFDQLPSKRMQEIAERVFKALAEKGPDNREVRRPTKVAELAAIADATEAEVIAVIEAFRQAGRSFLMPPPEVKLNSQSLIDVSHESLIRGWHRLRNWVEAEALSAAIYRRVAETAVLYEKGDAGLWQDPDLQVALGWQEKVDPNAAWGRRYHPAFPAAMTFIADSVAARDQELARKESQRVNELRRTRIFAVVLTFLLIMALALSVVAFDKRQEAVNARDEAVAARSEAVKQAERARQEEAKANTQRIAAEEAKDKELAAKQKAQHLAKRESLAQKRASAEADHAKHKEQEARASAALAKAKQQDAEEAQEKADSAQKLALRLATTNVIAFDELNASTRDQRDVLTLNVRLLNGAIGTAKSVLGESPDNRQAMNLLMIGRSGLPDIHRRQKDFPKARKVCAEFEKYADEDSGRDKSYTRRMLSAALLSSMAGARMRLEDEEAAVRDAQRATTIADTVLPDSEQADNESWKFLSITYNLTGQVQENYRHWDDALRDYQKAVAARKRVGNRDVDSDRSLLLYTQKVAQIQQQLGKREDVLKTYAEAIKAAEISISRVSPDPELIHDLAWVYLYRGDALREGERFTEAEADYNLAKSTAERLDAKTDNGKYANAAVAERFGSLWRDRANLEMDLDRKGEYFEKARKYYQSQMASYGALLDPKDVERRQVAAAYQRLASFENDTGNGLAAIAAIDRAISLLKPLGAVPGATSGDKTLLADAYGGRSWYDLFLGDFKAAISDAESGLAYDDKEIWIHTNEAHGYLFLGQIEVARKIYLENAEKRAFPNTTDNSTFRDGVLGDFEVFRKRGIPRVDLHVIDDIERVLKTKPRAP